MNKNLASPTHPAAIQEPKTTVPFWRQLRWMLILYFITLTILPMAFVVVVMLNQMHQQAENQTINQQLTAVAELKYGQIQRWLNNSTAILDVFLADSARKNQFIALVSPSSPPEQEQNILNQLLADTAESQSLFAEIFFYNAQGRILAASLPVQVGKVVTAQPYFANSLMKSFVQTPYYELGKNELTMLITRPLVNPQNGHTVGVLAGRLDMTALHAIMTDLTGLGDSGETYLVSRENNFLLTPSRVTGYPLERAYHSTGIDQALKGTNGSGAYPNYRTPPVPVLGVYRWIPELQTAMLVEIEETEALATYTQAQNISILLTIGVMVVAVGVGWYSATRIANPITALTQIATRIASGDFNQRAEISSYQEIGLLAAAFNSMTTQLQDFIDSLEERIRMRTRRLESVTLLSEQLSGILNIKELLTETVNQIQNSFGYYHTHIYLLDDRRESLVVAEGTGPAGAEMKAKGHHIPLSAPTSLVARAARTSEIVRVDKVRESSDWLPNPLLPNTQSEMAVPIILDNQVVGVLDVQQDKIAGLAEDDAYLLRSLANQVAITIRNARQFAQVESALTEAKAIELRYVEQSWDRTKIARKNLGRVQFSLGESRTLAESVVTQARRQALTHSEPTVVTLTGEQPENEERTAPSTLEAQSSAPYALVAPIMLRGVSIGDLQLHEINPERQWTENELALIRTVVDQVAQAAENLRLLDETQERASREQLIGQVSNKMRRAPDLESLMQVTVAELSRILGPTRTFVDLDLSSKRTSQGNGPVETTPDRSAKPGSDN